MNDASQPKRTRSQTRRGRLRLELRAVPADSLALNANNPETTVDPLRRRSELLNGLASALAKLADRSTGEDRA